MGLFSFRLPDELVETLDALAERDRKRRADLVRDALTEYVAARTAPVPRDEALRALEVLRQVVEDKTGAKEGLSTGVTEG